MNIKAEAKPIENTFLQSELLQLLEISKAINYANTGTSLLLAIREKVMQLIPFHDTGIFIVEKDGLHHYNMAVNIKGWDNSELNQKLYEQGLVRIPHLGSYVEFVEKQIENYGGGPVIENYEERFEQFYYPFFPVMKKLGFKEALVSVLKSGGRTYGTFWLNSLEKNHFQKGQFPLFQAIAEQVSVAVANILATEEIREGEKEKTILLSISEAVATIRGKQELLKFVFEKVKPLFSFYDAGFFVFSHNKQFVEDWTVSMPETSPSAANYKIAANNASSFLFHKSALNTFYRQLKEIKSPAIASYNEDLFARFPDYPQWDAIREIGYKESIGTLLRAEDGDLGILFFNSLTENHFSDAQFSLFQGIADQLATAVANILANENILEREKEKDVLLNVSQQLSSVKTADELLHIIIREVKPIFNFYDTGILLIDEEANGYYDLSVIHPHIDGSEVNYYLQGKGYYSKKVIDLANSGVAWILQQFKKEVPGIFKYTMDHSSFSDHELLDEIEKAGYNEAWVCPLIQQGKVFGVLTLNFKKDQIIPLEKKSLLLALSDGIASSLSNILANEEITEREKEKTQLLKISEAIASIQNYKELLKVIYELIQPVFPFDNTGLFIFDPLNEQLSEITHGDILSGTIPDNFADAKVLGPFELKDFKKSSWYFSTAPLITTLSKEVKLISDAVCKKQMIISIKAGLTQMICGPLLTGGKKIGAIYLSTRHVSLYKESHIHLFKSVTNLIAIAVANILANQEIVEREREKSLLLEINDAVVFIKDKASLFHLMMQKLQSFAGFDDAVLVMLSKDGNHCNGIIEAVEITAEGYGKFNGLIPLSTPIKNSPADFLRRQKDLYVWGLDEMENLYPNHPYLGMMRQKKLSYSVYLKVNWDVSKQVGFLNFHFKKKEGIQTKYFNLYKNIAYQLAASLSNIIAQEEIEYKAKEIYSLNKQLEAQNTYLVEEVEKQYNFEEMIGQNAQFSEVCRNIGLVAKTDSTVLILGETGTGKELVARAIHNNSTRKNKPLIKLNCAALPANLIESELFGHERGAFTGAIERRIGKFELANGSTLFLDEVGELPLELQAKLLRALQEKEIERLGSNKILMIDVRIIAATNRELGREVQAGKFRQDLFYRLHIFPITLPPLRERKEDIPLLASHFIERYAKRTGKKIQGLSNKAMQEMMSYNWPGNIRELEHVIERSVILAKTKLIQDLNLPLHSKKRISTSSTEFVVKTWEEQERDYILEVLKITKGNMAGKGGAAELLQLPPTTLQSKMNKLGIKRKHFLEKKGDQL